MTGGTIWDRLGIAPTEDVKAIRRAYADRLRATDADEDAEAFAALRHARDTALALAAAADAPPEELAAGPFDEEVPHRASCEPRPRELSPEQAEEAREAEERAERFREVERLLFTEEGDGPWAPGRLAQLTEAILADPIMERIDAAAGIEAWLADAAAASVPRSDPMLAILVAAFGWDRKWDRWDQPHQIVVIAERLRTLQFLAMIRDPSHHLHAAYLDLSSGGAMIGFFEGLRMRRTVRALLTRMRSRAPGAEQALDPYRVALWEERLTGRISARIWIAISVAGFVAVSFLSSLTAPDQDAGPSSQAPYYSSAENDLRPAIQAVVPHLGMEQIAAWNPGLAERLRSDWSDARSRGEELDSLLRREQAYLRERLHAGLRAGPLSLQARYWSLEADKLRWLRDVSPVACGDYIADGPHPEFPEEMYARETLILSDAVATDVSEAPPSAPIVRYQLPPAVGAAALARSGLKPAAFKSAVVGGGRAPERCAARIAVLETLLADSTGNAYTIRAMSAGL